jgi:CheY-like chemotaxis protein
MNWWEKLMQHTTWAGRRVLIVEDNTIVVMPLAYFLEDCGAEVIGPAPSLDAAFAAIDDAEQIDGAVLDVELGREMVWPVAFALRERGIPFVFATGSADGSIYPPAFLHARRFAKPYSEEAVAEGLHALIEDATTADSGLVASE